MSNNQIGIYKTDKINVFWVLFLGDKRAVNPLIKSCSYVLAIQKVVGKYLK